MQSATIKIFLVYGDPKRLRTAEISNWTGKADAAPRVELDASLLREEGRKAGIYFLFGTDPEIGGAVVYIGEAETIKDRLKAHLSRDFWSSLIFVGSKDDNLTKAHVRYLEGRLIEQAREAGRARVENGQSSGSRLPESDREEMEVFLSRVHQLLPVLGADFLVPLAASHERGQRGGLLVCDIKGLRAQGMRGASGFLVLRGSHAVLQQRASTDRHPYITQLRNVLIGEGKLLKSAASYEFVTDVEFSSPSAAASVIHGGTANGLTAWKTEDGRTLKEIEADSNL